MKIREIYRQELALRGIRLREMIEAEKWADAREPFAAAIMDKECPAEIAPHLRKLFGEIADKVYAPIRDRQ